MNGVDKMINTYKILTDRQSLSSFVFVNIRVRLFVENFTDRCAFFVFTVL